MREDISLKEDVLIEQVMDCVYYRLCTKYLFGFRP